MTMRLENNLSRTFEVIVDEGLLGVGRQDTFSVLDGRRVLIITTPTVDRLYGGRMRDLLSSRPLEFKYEVIELSEAGKTIENVQRVCASALYFGIGRKDVLVAFGGGVCSDIVGFAASMIRRGISHVRVPTTLIGQMDAGIGIKGGVNYRSKKNVLGCFHPPTAVLVDPSFLATLAPPYILQGLSEIIKVALVADQSLFETVRTHGQELAVSSFQRPKNTSYEVLIKAIKLTLAELQQNPFEDQTLERLLDFGHTFSPSLEEETGFTISHGEAVAIDMALTCTLAAELGIMPMEDSCEVIALLQELGLPIWSPLLSVDLCNSAIRHAMAHRGGALNLVVPTKIGKARFISSPERLGVDVIRNCIDQLTRINKNDTSASIATSASQRQLFG